MKEDRKADKSERSKDIDDEPHLQHHHQEKEAPGNDRSGGGAKNDLASEKIEHYKDRGEDQDDIKHYKNGDDDDVYLRPFAEHSRNNNERDSRHDRLDIPLL